MVRKANRGQLEPNNKFDDGWVEVARERAHCYARSSDWNAPRCKPGVFPQGQRDVIFNVQRVEQSCALACPPCSSYGSTRSRVWAGPFPTGTEGRRA